MLGLSALLKRLELGMQLIGALEERSQEVVRVLEVSHGGGDDIDLFLFTEGLADPGTVLDLVEVAGRHQGLGEEADEIAGDVARQEAEEAASRELRLARGTPRQREDLELGHAGLGAEERAEAAREIERGPPGR